MIISIISRVLFAAYFLEAGFVLIVAPWKAAFWDRNFFIERLPMLESLLSHVDGVEQIDNQVSVVSSTGLSSVCPK